MKTRPANARLAPRCAGLALLAAVAGCSLLNPAGAARPGDDAFDAGLRGLAAGSYGESVPALAAVARSCGTEPLGQQAALALTVLELDPRHEAGSPERAARLALHLLRRPGRAPWTARMASVLYLLAADRRTSTEPVEPAPVAELYPPPSGDGADGERAEGSPAGVAGCGSRFAAATADSTARPELPGTPTALRNARLEDRIRRLQAEVERLQSLLEPPEPR